MIVVSLLVFATGRGGGRVWEGGWCNDYYYTAICVGDVFKPQVWGFYSCEVIPRFSRATQMYWKMSVQRFLRTFWCLPLSKLLTVICWMFCVFPWLKYMHMQFIRNWEIGLYCRHGNLWDQSSLNLHEGLRLPSWVWESRSKCKWFSYISTRAIKILIYRKLNLPRYWNWLLILI